MKLRDLLLGLIELHPGATGYELKRIIEDSTGYFVNASLGQIYPALKELTGGGAVVFETDMSDGGRDRKRYTVTEEGRRQLLVSLRHVEPLPRSMAAFRQFLLHMTFIGHLDDEEIDSYIRTQLEHFRSERRRVGDDHLDMEREFLHLDGPTRARFLRIWESEYQYLVDDLDRKIAWMESILKD